MNMSNMTRQEIETLLRLLAEMEREALEWIMDELLEADRKGQVH